MSRRIGLVGVAAWGVVFGAGTQAEAADPAPQTVDEVVVTATHRSEGIAALKSPVPIQVIRGQALTATGYADLSRGLEFLDPSVNFNRAATTATAASTRPVTLRGLAPDQVLVLVNGKRRQASSILNTNNSIGRGSAPVDLNTIPDAAIDHVEILKDGAAAQYGSDAIAGVINIILRSDREGGYAAAQVGATTRGDGNDETVTGRAGFDLNGRGSLTLTGQVRHQGATNRANIDQRFNRVTYEIGDPRLTEYDLAFNGVYDLAAAGQTYLFGTAAFRDSLSAGGFRTPTTAPSLYPNGYVAHINPKIGDFAITGGWRNAVNGWHTDLSETFGWDRADFSVENTANLSLLAAGQPSPTKFDSGGVTYWQAVTDGVVSREWPSVLSGLNLAAGGQFREERYTIRQGEPLASFGAGADGFPGFEPRTPVDRGREAFAGFVDLELDVTKQLSLGAAARYDHYSDFGGAPTWKVTGRYAPTDWVAVRGAVSTGFRAPSMQQQYFSAVTNNLSSTGALVTVGTLPVSDPVARALGAQPLKAEKSRNASVGIVLTPAPNFSFTADWFRIGIRDRIALSEQLAGAQVASVLAAAGITQFQQVRFFTNALDTTTEGFEVAGQWSTTLPADARLDLKVGYGYFSPNIDQLRANPVLPNLPLLATKSLVFITTGQPKDKVTFTAGYEKGPFRFQVAATRFGQFQGDDLATLQTYGAKTLVDLTLSTAFQGFSFKAGVLNVGDVYPDQPHDNQLASIIKATGGSFPAPEEAPFGFNGRTWFVRVEKSF